MRAQVDLAAAPSPFSSAIFVQVVRLDQVMVSRITEQVLLGRFHLSRFRVNQAWGFFSEYVGPEYRGVRKFELPLLGGFKEYNRAVENGLRRGVLGFTAVLRTWAIQIAKEQYMVVAE